MIDRSETTQPDLVDVVDDVSSAGGALQPVLSRPVGRIRSPIMERGPVAAPPVTYRPGLDLPPIRSLMGPLMWALIPSLYFLLRVSWQAAIVAGIVAIGVREVRLRSDRASFTFGEGFLGYRGMNRWPQGVQEEDDVRWNWSAAPRVTDGQRAGS